MKACQWVDLAENRPKVASILSRKEYLDIPEQELIPSLCEQFVFSKNTTDMVSQDDASNYLTFSKNDAGFPWRSNADIILKYFSEQIGRDLTAEQKQAVIQQCYRTDLFREAARELRMTCPEQDYKTL